MFFREYVALHYSPEYVEGEFSEVRELGVLRSSGATSVLWGTYCAGAQTHASP